MATPRSTYRESLRPCGTSAGTGGWNLCFKKTNSLLVRKLTPPGRAATQQVPHSPLLGGPHPRASLPPLLPFRPRWLRSPSSPRTGGAPCWWSCAHPTPGLTQILWAQPLCLSPRTMVPRHPAAVRKWVRSEQSRELHPPHTPAQREVCPTKASPRKDGASRTSPCQGSRVTKSSQVFYFQQPSTAGGHMLA